MTIRRTICWVGLACAIGWLGAEAASTTQQGASPAAQPPAAPAAAPIGPRPVPPRTGKPMVLDKSVTEMQAERIAKLIAEASPIADPGDVKARDLAAEKLSACKDMIEAAQGKILWGGFHPKQGYNPEAYRLEPDSPLDYFQLTEFHPTVWAKLYLSTFMFPGTFQVRTEEGFTVLEMDAKFRSDLPPGEYPYPFWHSPNKWNMYLHAPKVLFIFDRGRLIAGLRKSPLPEELPLVKRKWDAKWTWTDEEGHMQPRVALFSYLFSKENPHIEALETSYRALEVSFRSQNCMICHSPDNYSKINDLLVLNYPNQALIMRRTLVTVLEANQMPPGSRTANEPAGIPDRTALEEMLKLAKDFEKKADAAMAYEQTHPKGQ